MRLLRPQRGCHEVGLRCVVCAVILLLMPFSASRALGTQDESPGVQSTDNLPADKSETDKQPDPERIGQLIADLTSAEFSRRQAATRQILEIGEPAIAPLQTAVASADAPLRERARQLLEQICSDAFRRHLTGLKADSAPEAATWFRDWNRFVAIGSAADSDETQLAKLFAELMSAEPSLWMERQFDLTTLSDSLERRSSELAAEFTGRPDEPFPVAAYLSLLLVASDESVRLPRATSANISAALTDDRLGKLVDDGVHKQVVQRLLGAWFLRPGIATEKPLLFAMQHELAGADELARAIIRRQSRRPEMLLSVLYLGRHRDVADLDLIESLLTNATVLWPTRDRQVRLPQEAGVPRVSGYVVQTCDVALAVAVHLRDESPADYGLSVRASQLTLFSIESLGFSDDAQRQAALTAYRAAFPGAGSR